MDPKPPGLFRGVDGRSCSPCPRVTFCQIPGPAAPSPFSPRPLSPCFKRKHLSDFSVLHLASLNAPSTLFPKNAFKRDLL